MDVTAWEDAIGIHGRDLADFEVLGPASEYVAAENNGEEWAQLGIDVHTALKNDPHPLPVTKDREGYYGERHFGYWASGLRDMRNLISAAERLGVNVRAYFDMGCASGRVIRHFAAQQPQIKTIGADINRRHVEWVMRFLPPQLQVFQNHSIPTLPIPDASIDLVSAFSVFTHVESFETAWLMELRRILTLGGIAWITYHSEGTWKDLQADWPLYKALARHPEFMRLDRSKPMPRDRLVFRWHTDRSYTSNVFYSTDYVRRSWSRYLEIAEVHRRLPGFQDVLILRKSG